MTGVDRHTVVWLVRHGQTAWNREQRYLSTTDQPLTNYGAARAAALGVALRRYALSAAVTSDLSRTRATAAAILARQRRPPAVREDDRWREVAHGRWEGLTYRQVSTRFEAEATARFADPWHTAVMGGETLLAVQARVRDAWRDLMRRENGGRILLVAHATPIQLILADLLGSDPARYWQFRIDLGSVTTIDLYPTAAIARAINLLPPLPGQA